MNEEIEESKPTFEEQEEVVEVDMDINEARSAMGLPVEESKEEPKEETKDDEKTIEEPIEDNPEEPSTDEEFDEITYNKELVKIPVSERETYLQKGYNYDKQHNQLTEYQTKVKELESLVGYSLDDAILVLKQDKEQNKITSYAEKNNLTEEEAAIELKREAKEKELDFKEKAIEHKESVQAKKKELSNEIYFKELENDIDTIIADNYKKGNLIDVETAYKYLLGEKAKELLIENKKQAAKQTLADVQDRAKRTVQKDSATETSTATLSKEAILMAREMGVSPKRLAKRLAKR